MRVTVKETCRGNGKIFTLFEVRELDATFTLAPEYPVRGGVELPFLVDEWKALDPSPDGMRRFVGTFPNLSGKSQAFTLRAVDAAAARRVGAAGTASLPNELKGEAFTYQLNFEAAKWESRLNYRVKPALCKQIRDFDEIGIYDRADMRFWQAIVDGDELILRGVVYTPYRADSQLSMTCLNERGEVISSQPINMGVNSIDTPFARERARREAKFSLRLPNECCRYFFDLRDANHPAFASLGALNDIHLRDMVNDYKASTTDAQHDPHYADWFEEHRVGRGELTKQQDIHFGYEPVFSIVIPLYNTPEDYFHDAVNAVRAQSYQNWELVLVNASPDRAELCGLCTRAVQADARIKLVTMERNEGISLNTNAGIAAATGDFVCFMDHDDTIEPDALFAYAEALNGHGDIDLIYCDEDKLDPEGTHVEPFFKPDFSIDLLRNFNYICHMLCIRKSLLDALEPNTPEFDGAQDHNLTLEAAERARRIHHVPRVLYHWRISASSTARGADSKTYTGEAGQRAVQAHLDRLGIDATVSPCERPNTYRVTYAVPKPHPLVSIVIPTKDHIDLLNTCISSILEKSTYDNYEVVVIENNSTEPETFAYYERLTAEHQDRIRVEYWPAAFNFSKLMNFGAEKAKGDYLLLLNNDTEVITPGWIEEMLGTCARPEVGIVGVRLLYPDRTIQHAGVYVQGDGAGHLGLNQPYGSWGYYALFDSPQNLSAVTAACLMTKRSTFEAVGGFTEELAVAFNDVDYCLKVRALGQLVVYTPEAELYHYESISRGSDTNPRAAARFQREVYTLHLRWAEHFAKGDPYQNPNLNQNTSCYALG